MPAGASDVRFREQGGLALPLLLACQLRSRRSPARLHPETSLRSELKDPPDMVFNSLIAPPVHAAPSQSFYGVSAGSITVSTARGGDGFQPRSSRMVRPGG
jgi:hypothetical protein